MRSRAIDALADGARTCELRAAEFLEVKEGGECR